MFDPKILRRAFGSYMTGVTVVTACYGDGVPVGFTANSFTSVSLDPPLLLVCPGNHLSSIDVFRGCTQFAVNILAEGQENVSNVFASSKENRFEQIEWSFNTLGVPLIENVLTHFTCKTHKNMDAGDHQVLIGEVVDFTTKEGMGLGYCKDGYFSLSKEQQAETTPNVHGKLFVGAIVESEDQIYVERKNGTLRLPQTLLSQSTKAREGIDKHLNALSLNVQIGRIYSLFHDADKRNQFMYFRATANAGGTTTRGEFLSIHDACNSNWELKAEATIVRRYRDERNNNAFGLYIGDAIEGEVHAND